MKKKNVEKVLDIVVVIIAIVILAFMIWAGINIFGELGELVEVAGTIIEHADRNITSGVVIDKEIVNGHTVNGNGGVIAGSNGTTGVVIGGNTHYVPTQYRLYISGEYELDGEIFEGEAYFDVPADVYQAYSIGDYFDSQNFKGSVASGSTCPSCGAECTTSFCGDCGTPMNPVG